MGTEIFPTLLLFAKFIVGAVGVIALLTMIAAALEYYIHRHDTNKKQEMKGHIVTSLIAIALVLVVYLLLSGIGPAFRILFQS